MNLSGFKYSPKVWLSRNGYAQTIYAPVDKHVSDCKFDFSFLKISPDHQVGERYLVGGGGYNPDKNWVQTGQDNIIHPDFASRSRPLSSTFVTKIEIFRDFYQRFAFGPILRISRQKVV